MAAPFGPPPSVAITRILPSGVTRDSVRRSISTRMTEPSGIATGPSGKRSPEAICVNAGLIAAIVSLLWSCCCGDSRASERLILPSRPVVVHPAGRYYRPAHAAGFAQALVHSQTLPFVLLP